MGGGGGHRLFIAGQLTPRLNVVGDGGEVSVLLRLLVVVGAVIGVVIRPVPDDEPAVALAPQGEGVLDAELLRGDAVQPGEVRHVALPQHHVHVALRLLRRGNGLAAQGVAVRGHGQVDGRQLADDAQVMPDGLVVGHLLRLREQVGGVDDPQLTDGLVVAVHEIQQQQLLPHGHAVGRRAADALKVPADKLRLVLPAPHIVMTAVPDLRLVHVGGQVLLLRRELVRLVIAAGNGQAAGHAQCHGQQQDQQYKTFHAFHPPWGTTLSLSLYRSL